MPSWCAVHRTHISPAIRSKINGWSKLRVSWPAHYYAIWLLHMLANVTQQVSFGWALSISHTISQITLSWLCVLLLAVSTPYQHQNHARSLSSVSRLIELFQFDEFLFLFCVLFGLPDAPRVSVHLANEDPIPSRLIVRAERENVTIKCRSDANPPADSFKWFKNVSYSLSTNTENQFVCEHVCAHVRVLNVDTN